MFALDPARTIALRSFPAPCNTPQRRDPPGAENTTSRPGAGRRHPPAERRRRRARSRRAAVTTQDETAGGARSGRCLGDARRRACLNRTAREHHQPPPSRARPPSSPCSAATRPRKGAPAHAAGRGVRVPGGRVFETAPRPANDPDQRADHTADHRHRHARCPRLPVRPAAARPTRARLRGRRTFPRQSVAPAHALDHLAEPPASATTVDDSCPKPTVAKWVMAPVAQDGQEP